VHKSKRREGGGMEGRWERGEGNHHFSLKELTGKRKIKERLEILSLGPALPIGLGLLTLKHVIITLF
jgi:hypothetical protein